MTSLTPDASPTFFEAVESLPDDQQKGLLDIVRQRRVECRRVALALSIQKARHDMSWPRVKCAWGRWTSCSASSDQRGGSVWSASATAACALPVSSCSISRGDSGADPRQLPERLLPDVHAVIAYHLRHRNGVNAHLAGLDAEAELLRVEAEARP